MTYKDPSNSLQYEFERIGVLKADPRLIFLEFKDDADFDFSFYSLQKALPPFDDALLIRNQQGQYGDFKLQLLNEESNIFEVPSSFSTRLFGTFSPGETDYVFLRNKKLLGIMLSKQKALRISSLRVEEEIPSRPKMNSIEFKHSVTSWKKRLLNYTQPN